MSTSKTFHKTQPLNRKTNDPTKLIYTGIRPTEDVSIQVFKYKEGHCEENSDISPDSVEKFLKDDFIYWLNVHGLHESEIITSLCQKQDIHSLVIQDILDVNQRPKFQEFEDYSFLTLKSIVPSESEILTEQISFVFGDNFLLSFQERKADFFEHLRYRLREDKGILRKKRADYLLYALIESILDNYFKTLNELDIEVDKLNFGDTTHEPSPTALKIIENHKKFVHFIKKSILPIKEFTLTVERGECLFIEKSNLKYFLEIKDLCLTLLDSCDMLITSLESSSSMFFSLQGQRMNQVMKTLTIVATIFIPLTFIAGIYGMNFRYMPELDWKYGYVAIWLVILAAFAGMLIYFKRKKWF